MESQIEASRDAGARVAEEDRVATREAIAALAHPRATGSDGAIEVGAELRRRFEELGYSVTPLPFTFSEIPGKSGLSAAGGVFLLGVALALPFLWAGNGIAALVALVVAVALIVLIVRYARRGVEKLRWRRADGENWLVHRTGARPRYVVAAHRDSKSQPISTVWRTAAIFGALLAWLALVVLSVLVTLNAELRPIIPLFVVGWVALVSGVLLLLCRVGNDSPGALDNASGLATMLAVAEKERESDDVAFLVTDAEELMLAGAAAVAKQIPPVEGIINIDIVDDEGEFQVVERFGLRRRGMAPHLVAALMSAADSMGLPARRRDVPLGVMVDHMAFADAGLPAVTLHRGTMRTFRRVHRPGDDMSAINGSGAAKAAAMIVRALDVLRSSTTVR